MPGVYTIPEQEDGSADMMVLFNVMSALNAVNSETKVVKGYVTHNSVWLTAEIYLDGSPELGDFFFRMLDVLHSARQRFYRDMEF
jgi:hypothetical protein